MAKVTLLFEDREDGNVSVSVISEPEFPADSESFTDAQMMAVQNIGKMVQEHNLLEGPTFSTDASE